MGCPTLVPFVVPYAFQLKAFGRPLTPAVPRYKVTVAFTAWFHLLIALLYICFYLALCLKKKDPYFKINVFKFNLPITFKLNMHFLHFVHSIKKVSV